VHTTAGSRSRSSTSNRSTNPISTVSAAPAARHPHASALDNPTAHRPSHNRKPRAHASPKQGNPEKATSLLLARSASLANLARVLCHTEAASSMSDTARVPSRESAGAGGQWAAALIVRTSSDVALSVSGKQHRFGRGRQRRGQGVPSRLTRAQARRAVRLALQAPSRRQLTRRSQHLVPARRASPPEQRRAAFA